MISTIFLSAIFVVVTLFVTKFIFKPYIKCKQYEAKDARVTFYPIFGMILFIKKQFKETGDFFGFYKQLPKHDQNVRLHVGNIGPKVVLQLLDTKLIKEFYSHQSKYVKIPLSKAFQALVGTGLLRAEGNLWKQHRKTISSLFHYEFLKQNTPLIVKTTREFLDQLKKEPLENIKIMDEIQKITGEIVGRIFFGENLNNYNMDGQLLTLYLADLLVEIFQNQRTLPMVFTRFVGGSPNWNPHFREIQGKVQEFRKVCFKIINDRKASGIKSNDMLGLLLESQNNPHSEDAFSDEDIANEFITFFAAGMDTTGHAIAMMLYLLYNNPQYYKNFESEINTIYNQEDPVTHDSLNKMDFTHAFLKETLRFYTPAPGIFSRTALEDHQLLDVKIKKGMTVRPNPMYNHFNPKYFPEPEKFSPERWLDKSQSLDPYAYIPFSAGARNCIGQHLSIIETKIIMSEFLKRFEFEVPKDYDLKMSMGFLYEPAQKLRMNLKVK